MISLGKNSKMYNKIRELVYIRRFIVRNKEHIKENDAAQLYYATQLRSYYMVVHIGAVLKSSIYKKIL